MLTADQLDSLTDPILELYRQFEDSVIRDIARRLAGMDMTSTAAWQAQRLSESGMLFDDILKRLAELTHRSETELRTAFERAGVKAMRFDDAIYRAAGLNPLPLNLSPAMVQVLAAGLRKTGGLIRNLTMSTASTGQDAFIQAADLAYMQVSTGAMAYTQAIREAVVNIANQGLTIINYASGRREQLDVAMRRAVLTGINQTAGNLQITRADEMGVDLVQTSAHVGARNKGTGPANHEGWQGKIFSRSGTHREYPGFIVSTGYGTGAGLCGWNCRHSFYPFFEGISENAYSQAELEGYAKRTVQYNGETISVYDATQKQRYIERKIRHWKRQEGALKAARLDSAEETAKVREWQAQMRDFTKQTGLIRQSERERIYSGKPEIQRTPISVKMAPAGPPSEPPSISEPLPAPSPQYQPAGKSVSKAIKVKPGTKSQEIDDVLAVIDSVHGDGNLPVIGAYTEKVPGRENAAFEYTKMPGTRGQYVAMRVVVSSSGKRSMFSTAHELGHFLDLSGMGTDMRFASSFDQGGLMKEWWTAIKNSESYQELKRIYSTGIATLADGRTGVVSANNRKHIKYLLDPTELWARSYAQYIATKSKNSVMMNELNEFRNNPDHFPAQWSDDDFAEIMTSIDQLFLRLGWLK